MAVNINKVTKHLNWYWIYSMVILGK